MSDVPVMQWTGAYEKRWKGFISDESMAHPAKASRALLDRIFDYLFEIGALKKGDVCVDVFGGVSTTAVVGAMRGVQVITHELEEKFWLLGLDNLELHRRDWADLGCPQPIAVQGDSRYLRQSLATHDAASKVLRARAAATIASPVYAEGLGHGGTPTTGGGKEGDTVLDAMQSGYGHSSGQLAKMAEGSIDVALASPPYEAGCARTGGPDQKTNLIEGGKRGVVLEAYGSAPGQLQDMDGYGGVDAILSSPPYAAIAAGAGGLNTLPAKDGQQGGRNPTSPSQQSDQRYGETRGQLARLPEGAVEAVVSSPPFLDARSDTTPSVKGHTPTAHDPEAMGASTGNLNEMVSGSIDCAIQSPPFATGDTASAQSMVNRTDKSAQWIKAHCGSAMTEGYGLSEGQLGVMDAGAVETADAAPETFWGASLTIVRETFEILRPGGVSVWILKKFVRAGELQHFDQDWRRLCEHVGFETFLEVHAMLSTQWEENTLFDGVVQKERRRVSFFRRLAEKRGSPRIDFETVLFMRKKA